MLYLILAFLTFKLQGLNSQEWFFYFMIGHYFFLKAYKFDRFIILFSHLSYVKDTSYNLYLDFI